MPTPRIELGIFAFSRNRIVQVRRCTTKPCGRCLVVWAFDLLISGDTGTKKCGHLEGEGECVSDFSRDVGGLAYAVGAGRRWGFGMAREVTSGLAYHLFRKPPF